MRGQCAKSTGALGHPLKRVANPNLILYLPRAPTPEGRGHGSKFTTRKTNGTRGKSGFLLRVEAVDLGLEEPAVQVEPDRHDVAVLLHPQQVPRPPKLKVLQGDLKS